MCVYRNNTRIISNIECSDVDVLVYVLVYRCACICCKWLESHRFGKEADAQVDCTFPGTFSHSIARTSELA